MVKALTPEERRRLVFERRQEVALTIIGMWGTRLASNGDVIEAGTGYEFTARREGTAIILQGESGTFVVSAPLVDALVGLLVAERLMPPPNRRQGR